MGQRWGPRGCRAESFGLGLAADPEDVQLAGANDGPWVGSGSQPVPRGDERGEGGGRARSEIAGEKRGGKVEVRGRSFI